MFNKKVYQLRTCDTSVLKNNLQIANYSLIRLNLPWDEPFPIRVDVSGEFTAGCVVTMADWLYVIRTSLRLPTVVDWSVFEADVLCVAVSCDVDVDRLVLLVNSATNVVDGSRDVPKDIDVVLVDVVNVAETRVLTIAL